MRLQKDGSWPLQQCNRWEAAALAGHIQHGRERERHFRAGGATALLKEFRHGHACRWHCIQPFAKGKAEGRSLKKIKVCSTLQWLKRKISGWRFARGRPSNSVRCGVSIMSNSRAHCCAKRGSNHIYGLYCRTRQGFNAGDKCLVSADLFALNEEGTFMLFQ